MTGVQTCALPILLKSLKEEAKGKTIVLVSHRASTMRIADESYSVENGRLSRVEKNSTEIARESRSFLDGFFCTDILQFELAITNF